MPILLYILLATIIDGFVALAGASSLLLKEKTVRKLVKVLIAFSAGALLSGAFFHLLAESIEELPIDFAFYMVFAGFILFFLIEKFLHWHHCHEGECDVHPVSYLILFGDAVHNFIDGLVIAASFLVDISFGVITTLLILGHEFPQELGDFAIMLHGGMEKRKALFYNFLAQLTAVAGGLLGYFLSLSVGSVSFLLPFAAGGFIYIAASDLVPELHKEKSLPKSMLSFLFFLVGIGFMLALKLLFA